MTRINRDNEWLELMGLFVPESLEMLDEAESQLIELEKRSKSRSDTSDVLNSIFRFFHSLKGGAGCLNLELTRDLTHGAETLLERFRDHGNRIESRHIDLLCRTSDLVRKLLDEVSLTYSDRGLEKEVHEIRQRLSEANLKLSGQPELKASAPDLACSLSDLDLEITPEMRGQFFTEGDGLLNETREALSTLEKQPQNFEFVHKALKAMRTFRGIANFFGYGDLLSVSANIEKILRKLKNSTVGADFPKISLCLSAVDFLRKGVSQVKEGEFKGLDGKEEILHRLTKTLDEDFREEVPMGTPKLGEILVEMGMVTEDDVKTALDLQISDSPPDRKVSNERSASQEDFHPEIKRPAIRVDIDKLDKLLNLVGELVISESAVINSPDLAGLQLDRFEKASYQLRKITKDLQSVAMSVRMIPITSLFKKMVRIVRDSAQICGKEVNLQLRGEDTEVDKSVIELMNDPLVHMIRNAIDHGIETPDERKKSGKPEKGEIILEARYSGNEVWIIIKDDGRGLDRGKIAEKARETGLLVGGGGKCRDEDIFKFIFEPGFSTAGKVTDLSGRGVGMDVVKQNIEKLKGRMEIQSIRKEGSSFIIRIPLTLAIIDGMMIRVGSQKYILPTQAILEAFKPTPSAISTLSEKGEMILSRNRLIPLFRISDLFKLEVERTRFEDGIVIVVQDAGATVGFLVDEIMGQQQTVIKSLGPSLGEVPGIAGAAVLADGRVGLILNAPSLINLATRENFG